MYDRLGLTKSRCRILSSTATLLYISYNMHNIVSWLKIKPFLPRWGGWVFIISLMLAQPYWVLETWANFQYFNELGSDLFQRSRYFEPLMRYEGNNKSQVSLCSIFLATRWLTFLCVQRPMVDLHHRQARHGHQQELRIHASPTRQDQPAIRHHASLHVLIYCISGDRCGRHGQGIKTEWD